MRKVTEDDAKWLRKQIPRVYPCKLQKKSPLSCYNAGGREKTEFEAA